MLYLCLPYLVNKINLKNYFLHCLLEKKKRMSGKWGGGLIWRRYSGTPYKPRPLAPLVSLPGFQQDTLTTCSRPSSLGQAASLRHKHLPLLAVVSFRRHTSTFFSSSSLCGFVVSDKSVDELIFAHAQQVNNLVWYTFVLVYIDS